MLSRIISWFETRIDPFAVGEVTRPPDTLFAFYRFFIQPLWPFFVMLLIAGFLGSSIEVALMAFVGSIVDRMRTSTDPSTFLTEHGTMLLLMASVALILRPIVSTAHDLIKNQMMTPAVTTGIRWKTHRYVLRQSLGFFQNDFAGRIANKIIQTGTALRESIIQLIDALWYASVQFFGAAALFAAADWRLTIPLLAWVTAIHLGALLFRAAHQSALDGGVRSPLDARRPHRRQLHEHHDGQALRSCRTRGCLCARRADRSNVEVAGLAASDHRHGDDALPAEWLPAGRGLRHGHLALDAAVRQHRRYRRRQRACDPHRRDVGLGHVDDCGRFRKHRRGSRRHGDDRAAEPAAGRPRR